MKIILFWIHNARHKALPQSLLPAILALCLASRTEGFSFWLGLLSVAGIAVAHLGMNLFDDYFDYKVKGPEYRDSMAKKGFRARIAKCRYITSGEANLNNLLTACCAFGIVALSIGFILFLFRGGAILWFALIATLLGISYSGAPLRLSYHGLGEIFIGIIFGPLLMAGVYYSACGQLDYSVLFISIPVGLLVVNIVYTHAIMDYEPDREANKMTLAVLLKNRKRMLTVLFILLAASFLSITGGVITGYLPPVYLFTLLALPMAVSLFHLMIEFVHNPQKKFSPRFWMGPMGNWQRIQTCELDWFMIRWLLARNLLSFFCLIIILISFFQ
jgi:1,4-dihydroxy-2-naphthoate octaprenyltransferase